MPPKLSFRHTPSDGSGGLAVGHIATLPIAFFSRAAKQSMLGATTVASCSTLGGLLRLQEPCPGCHELRTHFLEETHEQSGDATRS